MGVTETVEVVATVGGAAPPSSLPGDEPAEQQDAALGCSVEAELIGLNLTSRRTDRRRSRSSAETT